MRKGDQGLSPIFVGIIGHRNINRDELDQIQRDFDLQIAEILDQAQSTPVVILTSLADGADRLIFTSKFRSRVQVYGVLPFKVSNYAKDFIGKAEKAKFLSLINSCEMIIDPSHMDSTSRVLEARALGYRIASEWIVTHSTVLLAVWDGRFSSKVGGTGDTLRRDGFDISHTSRHGQNYKLKNLFHISASNGSLKRIQNCTCPAHSKSQVSNLELIRDLNRLNIEIGLVSSPRDYRSLEKVFEHFDNLANYLKKRFVFESRILTILGFFTVNFAAIQQDTFSIKWLVATFVLATLTLLVWRISILRNSKSQYETTRLIAEFLRIQLFWQASGIDTNLRTSSSAITLLTDSDPVLAQYVIGLLHFSAIDSNSKKVKQKSLSIASSKKWLRNQITYLDGVDGQKGALRKNYETGRRYTNLSRIMLALSLTFLISPSVLQTWISVPEQSLQASVFRILFTVTISLSAVFAAYAHAMGFKDLAKRYSMSSSRFRVLDSQFIAASSKKAVLSV